MGTITPAPQGRAAAARLPLSVSSDPNSRPSYNSVAELIDDTRQFADEYRSYRAIIPERRSCVYGISESIPFFRGYR